VLFIFSFLDVIDLGGPFVECPCLKFFALVNYCEIFILPSLVETHLGFVSVGFNSLCMLS
jgi:hypothetical protein